MTTSNGSKPVKMQPGVSPTDLELMMFADGELDEPRASEVASYVRDDARGRAKSATMGLVGMALRARPSVPASEDLVDAIMARVQREVAPEAAPQALSEAAPQAKVVDAPGAVVRPIAVGAAIGKAKESGKSGLERRPANDNARTIFGLAAAAVAVAAGFMIWGRVQSEVPQLATSTPSAMTVDSATLSPVLPQGVAAVDDGDNPGVEVAAVDFGARMGTIFYVPTGASDMSPTTAVVWLSDDLGGGAK
ncbi:hypothetical protein [Chondromyces apiculatus]|uniref:Anti-sigma factor n=1 Tax=Chondromyces apiculatus DSM 436 TaxID=1192034 RepID=A0A017TB49_9BACT|nr:hypothetical protein [Chondromyces apiculatus]EYF05856.1 Hypothetical protein CAP_2857 [Chondromyces apiculatus DSM 436]